MALVHLRPLSLRHLELCTEEQNCMIAIKCVPGSIQNPQNLIPTAGDTLSENGSEVVREFGIEVRACNVHPCSPNRPFPSVRSRPIRPSTSFVTASPSHFNSSQLTTSLLRAMPSREDVAGQRDDDALPVFCPQDANSMAVQSDYVANAGAICQHEELERGRAGRA